MHHASTRKQAVCCTEVFALAGARFNIGTVAGLRDATMAMVAFFGVRRVSEVLQLWRKEVVVEESCVSVWVRRQKNDTEGVGSWYWVPRDVGLPGPTPAGLIEAWLSVLDSMFTGFEYSCQLFASHICYVAFRSLLPFRFVHQSRCVSSTHFFYSLSNTQHQVPVASRER